MIFKVPGGTKIHDLGSLFFVFFSDASSGMTFLILLSHLGRFLALHGAILAPNGVPEGVPKS